MWLIQSHIQVQIFILHCGLTPSLSLTWERQQYPFVTSPSAELCVLVAHRKKQMKDGLSVFPAAFTDRTHIIV